MWKKKVVKIFIFLLLFLFAFNVYLPFNNESVNAIIPPPRTANYTVYVSGLPSQSRSPISASGGDYKSSSWNSSSQQLTVTYSNFVVYPSFTLTAVAPSGYIFHSGLQVVPSVHLV